MGSKEKKKHKSVYHANSSSYPKYMEQLESKKRLSQLSKQQQSVIEEEVTPEKYIDSLMDKERDYGIERGFMTSKLR